VRKRCRELRGEIVKPIEATKYFWFSTGVEKAVRKPAGRGAEFVFIDKGLA
jgi:hypothetical protein